MQTVGRPSSTRAGVHHDELCTAIHSYVFSIHSRKDVHKWCSQGIMAFWFLHVAWNGFIVHRLSWTNSSSSYQSTIVIHGSPIDRESEAERERTDTRERERRERERYLSPPFVKKKMKANDPQRN